MEAIKIQISSLSENIRIIESFIDNAKDKYNFTDDVYGNIMIAVTESVNNAIIHGNNYDKNKKVNLSLNLEESQIRFTIQDEGTGFDHENLDDPTDPENLEKLGGRGIFLMKNLCDEISFTENGKKVELCFYLT